MKAHITYSTRAKRLRARIHADDVWVTAPHGTSEEDIQGFLQTHRKTISAKQTTLKEAAQRANIHTPQTLEDKARLTLLGTTFTLKINATCTPQIDYENREIHLKAPAAIAQAAQQTLLKQKLNKVLKELFAQYADHIIHTHKEIGAARGLTLRAQRSRWGSCSHKNTLSLNWWLIFAPEPVARYVIIHELCHIQHKNHSADFWALVAQHNPSYKKQQLWLNTYGQALQERAQKLTTN